MQQVLAEELGLLVMIIEPHAAIVASSKAAHDT